MKIGFLFPGQGAQQVGMGKDLYENYKEAKEVYDEVSQITGIDIKKISFEGPEEVLNKTQYTQIAVLTESLAIIAILKKHNIQAEMSAGLSLGEYTALIEDGIFNFEDGVKLVQKRGEIMQNLIPKGDWKMAAVLGLEATKVEEVCKQVNGFVVPSNYNTIGQTVLSGEEEYVVQAGELAKQAGAKKISILKEELKKVTIHKKQSKVLKNIDGVRYEKEDDIVEILGNHIINPVRFSKDLQAMYDNGIDTFIEVGPGKSLSGFVRKINKELKILNVNSVETLQNLISIS